MKFKIGVITSIPFPNGMAGTNRIISYSKGLVELGHEVTVLTTHSGERSKLFFKGIGYISFREAVKSSLLSKVMLVLSVFRLFWFLIKSNKQFDHLILVSNSLPLILLTYIACRVKRIKLIQEKSEFPFVLNAKSILGKIYASLYVNNVYKLFDGMIIMTSPLLEYFKSKINSNCKTVVIPMTVEPERFENQANLSVFNNAIAYCGYMGGNKDGVKNLIEAYSLIENEFPEMQLLLIGSATKAEMDELKALVVQLKLKTVNFYGQVDRDTMPSILSSSKVLVLARPSSLQSTGGFPTKLGEYLSTGKPVVVTKVGDIPKYLKHEVHAFLAEPDDIEGFANAIKVVLNNYEMALKIGSEGRKLTATTFNYKVQAKNIETFLETIK